MYACRPDDSALDWRAYRRRRVSFLSSSAHRTKLAMPAQSAHWPIVNGVVSKASLSRGRWMTATWSSSETVMAAHNRGLVNRLRKALVRSERALKQLNSLRLHRRAVGRRHHAAAVPTTLRRLRQQMGLRDLPRQP